MRVNLLREIEVPVRSLLDRRQRLVLAVSGGIDSAVLLDAITRLRSPAHHLVVATVDHGTGEAATDAVALTVATAAAHRIPAITERLRPGPATEAEWRRRRWLFLRQLAAREDAVIVTAHTRDDQIETVVMRLLRGAGARGLAGLYAPSSIERPLLSASRADVMYYASRRRVAWVDDPSNLSVAYLRNRVRLNLLPAIRAVRPAFDNEILDLAHRAAQLRARVEEVAASMIVFHGADEVTVNADMLAALDNEGRRLLWPALAARVGAALDRRGIVRLAEFVSSPIGSRVPVSGGFEATRRRNEIVLRKRRNPASMSPRPIRGGASFGAFRFEAVPLATIRDGDRPHLEARDDADPWRIRLDSSLEPIVREWVPGDRLRIDSRGSRRRVKRFLADAGIPGSERPGWPVVEVNDDIVWIPGVRACPETAGGGGVTVEYRCERIVD